MSRGGRRRRRQRRDALVLTDGDRDGGDVSRGLWKTAPPDFAESHLLSVNYIERKDKNAFGCASGSEMKLRKLLAANFSN